MKPACKLLALVATFSGLSLAAPIAEAATTLYTENFNYTTGTSLGSIGWAGYYSSSATSVTTSFVAIQNGAGTGDGSNGRVYTAYTQVNRMAIIENNFGTAIPIDFSSNSYQITFDSVQTSSIGRLQVLLRVADGDGNSGWYVSNTVFTPVTSAGFGAAGQALSLDLVTDASAWSSFNLTPGTGMSVSSTLTSPLNAAQITGIGFYLTNTHATSGATVRIDTLQVSASAVPEPSAYAAFAGLLALGGAALRRRSRR